MSRFLLQFILLGACTGLTLALTLGAGPEAEPVGRGVEPDAESASGSAARPSASGAGFEVTVIDGVTRREVSRGGELETVAVTPGPIDSPAVLRVASGALRVRRGETEFEADEEARLFIGEEGLRLDAGRLRVDAGTEGRAVLVVAGGARIEGRRFGLWLTSGDARLAALSEATVDGVQVPAGHGGSLGQARARAFTPLPERLELVPGPGPRPGLRQSEVPAHGRLFVQRDAALIPRTPLAGTLVYAAAATPLVRDALGRWAVPGRPSKSLEDVAAAFPVAGDRAVLDRLRMLSRATEAAPPPDKAPPLQRRRSRGGGASRGPPPTLPLPRKPSPAPEAPSRVREAPAEDDAPSEEPRDPPDSIRVDWTQIGRPSGSVFDGQKKEAPAPESEE